MAVKIKTVGAHNCPICGGDSHIIETRVNVDGRIRRRRVCLNPTCKYRFSTIENYLTDDGKKKA